MVCFLQSWVETEVCIGGRPFDVRWDAGQSEGGRCSYAVRQTENSTELTLKVQSRPLRLAAPSGLPERYRTKLSGMLVMPNGMVAIQSVLL
jgi:autotransporter translocation and assembly factor TamB